MKFKRVVIESPYAGDIKTNVAYARHCMADSLTRHEAPFASHLLYTQKGLLNDNDPDERLHGIQAGFAWGEVAEIVAVYTDRGISSGMQKGIDRATEAGIPIEYRKIGKPWS